VSGCCAIAAAELVQAVAASAVADDAMEPRQPVAGTAPDPRACEGLVRPRDRRHARARDGLHGAAVDVTAHLFTISSFCGGVVFVAAVLLVLCVGDMQALPAVMLLRARASAVVIVDSREVPLPPLRRGSGMRMRCVMRRDVAPLVRAYCTWARSWALVVFWVFCLMCIPAMLLYSVDIALF
jgi:hypothetical protein